MPSIPAFRRASRAALLFSCCVAGLPSAAWSQDPASADESNAITVTGRRVSQSSEAIGEDKISNVVAVMVILVTALPILAAYYLTREGEHVAGAGK